MQENGKILEKYIKKRRKFFEKQYFFRFFYLLQNLKGDFIKKLQKLDDKYILYVKNDEKMKKTNI